MDHAFDEAPDRQLSSTTDHGPAPTADRRNTIRFVSAWGMALIAALRLPPVSAADSKAKKRKPRAEKRKRGGGGGATGPQGPAGPQGPPGANTVGQIIWTTTFRRADAIVPVPLGGAGGGTASCLAGERAVGGGPQTIISPKGCYLQQSYVMNDGMGWHSSMYCDGTNPVNYSFVPTVVCLSITHV